MNRARFCLLVLVVVLLCGIVSQAQLNCSGGIFGCVTGITTNGTAITVVNALTAFQLGGVSLAGNLPATATNDSATAGNVGEFMTQQVTSGSPVTLASGSATPITSINLTAGDWDVYGVVDYIPNSATSVTLLAQGTQLLNNCMTAGPALDGQDTFTQWETAANVIGSANPAWNVPYRRVSIATTTRLCLVAKATFSLNTLTAYGTIMARRAR